MKTGKTTPSKPKVSSNGHIKGVKIVNNQNALRVNKFSGSGLSSVANGHSQSEKEIGIASSAKHAKLTSMLSDYDKTKTFNQELLKNFGSPKGPAFTRVSNPYAHYQEQDIRNI